MERVGLLRDQCSPRVQVTIDLWKGQASLGLRYGWACVGEASRHGSSQDPSLYVVHAQFRSKTPSVAVLALCMYRKDRDQNDGVREWCERVESQGAMILHLY